MKTKAFTDIKQSEKLAKILRVESADLWYAECYDGHVESNGEYVVAKEPYYYPSLTKPSESNYSQDTIKDIPCWSLAALLSILPRPSLHRDRYGKWYCDAEPNRLYFSSHYDNPVDACVEMILKLHELNLL